MNLKNQKYSIISFLLLLNCLLSITLIIFEKKWYAFILFLCLPSLLYSTSSILLIIYNLFKKNNNYDLIRENQFKNYLYVIPCYNESEIELLGTLTSLTQQKICKNDKRAFIIVCDGQVTGQGNNKSTDKILLSILNVYSATKPPICAVPTC